MARNKSGDDDFLLVRGSKIPVQNVELKQAELRFFPANPRIFSAIGAEEGEPEQSAIEKKLRSMDHVKELAHDIRLNGGLMDPIVVKDGSFEVLEGNSRLAAYRVLAEKDPFKWGKIKARLIPAKTGDDLIFALLGQYHIKGKKDWLPFEQAGFLYRRHQDQGISQDQLADELGLKNAEVKNLIATYSFMVDHKCKDPGKWSYFFELIKSRKVANIRRANEEFDEIIVKQIKSGEIEKAVDVRDGLKLLAKAPKRTLSKFLAEEYSLEDAAQAVHISGNANDVFQRAARIRTWLAKDETEAAIRGARKVEKDKIKFELEKLVKVCNAYLRKLR